MSVRRVARLCLAIVVSIPTYSLAQPEPGKPNILWITVEDITTFVGAYGSRAVRTPNIDKLAEEGMLYSRAFTVSGVCAPSRAAIITGMYPTSVGAHHMRTQGSHTGSVKIKDKPDGLPPYDVVLPPEVKAFPEYLRLAGYYTSNNQKTDYQFDAPVTVWDENGPAASFRNRPSGKPFFSVFNFFQTHESLITLAREPLLVDPARVEVPPIYPDTPAVRGDLARLYSNIERMDGQVGELIQMLKDDGLYENTIIFFFSDNGGNLPWMKREVLERGTHIPFIVRIPGGRHAGTTNDELISGVDLAPTVLSLVGVPIPTHMQGQAFLGEQKARVARRYVFSARDRMDSAYDRVRSVRDQRYRYLYNHMPEKPYYQDIAARMSLPSMREISTLHDAGTLPAVTAGWFDAKPVEELYDVAEDPWELNNLAADPIYKGKLEELRKALQDWTARYGDLGGKEEKDIVREMWNGGDEAPVTAMPEVLKTPAGVKLACATPGASMGYWVERKSATAPAVSHRVQSWDYGILLGPLFSKNPSKNGDSLPRPVIWTVYDGQEIGLQRGDILHINAQRIGYAPALADYKNGKLLPLSATAQ